MKATSCILLALLLSGCASITSAAPGGIFETDGTWRTPEGDVLYWRPDGSIPLPDALCGFECALSAPPGATTGRFASVSPPDGVELKAPWGSRVVQGWPQLTLLHRPVYTWTAPETWETFAASDAGAAWGEASTLASSQNVDQSDARLPQPVPLKSTTKLPEYPAAARRAEQTGITHLRVCIGTDGRVTSSEVVHSSGAERLDDATVKWAFKGVVFQPQVIDGKPVTVCGVPLSATWELLPPGAPSSGR